MKKKAYLPVIIFLWAIVPFYYFATNSFTGGIDGAAAFLQSILALLVLNSAAFAIGSALFYLTKIDVCRSNMTRLYKVATGYGIIFITLLFLGMLGLYNPFVLNAYLVLLLILCGFGIMKFAKDLPTAKPPAAESVRFSAVQTLLLSLISFVVMTGFITALVPPVARDSIIHHLAVPKLYLKSGGIIPIEFMPYTFRSINLELLYMLALFVKNDIIARAIHFNFYILSTIAVYFFVRDSFSKNAALLSTLLFASTPVIFNTATRAYVDLGMTFFGIMLINALMRYLRDQSRVYLVLGGMMAGLCASTKINGYLFVMLAFFWLVSITQRKKQSLKEVLITVMTFLLFAFIFDVHLLVKNAVQTKNPFYPVFSRILKPPAVSDDEMKLLPIEVRKLMYNQTATDELTVPWALSTDVESRALYTVDGVLGPVFIIFIPFVFLIKKKRYELLSLLAIAGVYKAICWGLWGIRIRYLIILFPLALYVLSAVIDEFFTSDASSDKKKFANPLLTVIITVIFTLNAYHILGYVAVKEPFEFLTGKVTREQYISKHYRQYEIFRYINENITGEDALIYFLDFGTDGYYSDVDYTYDTSYLGRTFFDAVKAAADPADLKRRITDTGITHLLINIKYFKDDLQNNYTDKERELIYGFMNNYVRQLKRTGDEVVYEIRLEIRG